MHNYKKNKSIHGDKPLIDTKEVKEKADKEMTRIEKAGPERYDPADIESVRDDKRETITTEHVRSYEFIPTTDEYAHLRQQVSLNLKSVDFRDAMKLLAEIGDVNILVGDEVSGTVTAKIIDVSWEVAFKTLLDMKTLGADIDAKNGIIRVHTPEKLNQQEEFKSARSEVLEEKKSITNGRRTYVGRIV